MYAQNPTKSRGVRGYNGTLKGRSTSGFLRLKTNRLSPVHKKKNQKTGAVKSTIDSKPFRVNAPKIIKAVAIKPCKISEFTGADLAPFHFPKKARGRKSFPSA